MDWSVRAALWIVATGVIAAGLFFLREPLTQFALAFILWLAIDGLANVIRERLHFLPAWSALPIALVLVLSLTALIAYVIASNVGTMVLHYKDYEGRLNTVIGEGYAAIGGTGAPPSLAQLLHRVDPTRLVGEFGQGLRGIASDTMFILIYLGFLFPASAMMSKKLNFIFGRGAEREVAREVFHRIRVAMEQYLWVQTVLSLITTALTYITLVIIGLENALFWSFVIFFLNYIPTIGSIIAVVVVTAAALIQPSFTTFVPVALCAGAVTIWQFVIGNFVQPRMTGDSLNLSALVVLLALAIWGLIWGLAGAFLAAPLTVMLMIVLAQFPATRWIAILLSADGKPTPRSLQVSKLEPEAN